MEVLNIFMFLARTSGCLTLSSTTSKMFYKCSSLVITLFIISADGNYEVTIMTKAILHYDGR